MQLVLMQPQLEYVRGPANTRAIQRLLGDARLTLAADDIVLLPEGFHFGTSEAYRSDVRTLARELGCHVVGGSHRESSSDRTVNAGLVFDGQGHERARYEKLRPYGNEREHVVAGTKLGMLQIAGRNVLILICADFWFADVFAQSPGLPDLVLVPALSVTRKPTPEYSRTLWQHIAVARAYEFGTYVGVSDWGYPSRLPALFTSGVAGFANPTTSDARGMFEALGAAQIRVFQLDFPALEAFRRDRVQRGFFWKRQE